MKQDSQKGNIGSRPKVINLDTHQSNIGIAKTSITEEGNCPIRHTNEAKSRPKPSMEQFLNHRWKIIQEPINSTRQ